MLMMISFFDYIYALMSLRFFPQAFTITSLKSVGKYLTFRKNKIHIWKCLMGVLLKKSKRRNPQDAVEMKKFVQVMREKEDKHLKRETLQDKFSR